MKESAKGSTIGSVIGSVEDAVTGSMEGLVTGSMEGLVKGSMEGSVKGSMEGLVKGSMEGSVKGSMEGSVKGSVEGSVKGSMEGSVKGSPDDGEVRIGVEYEVEKGRQQEKAIDEAIRCLFACKVESGEMVYCDVCEGWSHLVCEGRCGCDGGEGVCVHFCVSAMEGRGEKMAALPEEGSLEFPPAIGEPRSASLMAPDAEAMCMQQRHCGRGKRSMDAVVRRRASRVASRVAAGSESRKRSWSAKRVHLQRCTTVKEILVQVGDAPEHRAVPSAPVESGYGRKHKVFCQRVVTNIATVVTLNAEKGLGSFWCQSISLLIINISSK